MQISQHNETYLSMFLIHYNLQRELIKLSFYKQNKLTVCKKADACYPNNSRIIIEKYNWINLVNLT